MAYRKGLKPGEFASGPLGFGCGLYELKYDFLSRHGTIRLEGCCDMGACIELFQRIDPKVEFIQTYDRFERDTAYVRYGKRWECERA